MLAAHLRHMGVNEISLAALDGVYRADYLESWYGLPKMTKVDTCIPKPGWTVIGATFEKEVRFDMYGLAMPNPWYEQVVPTERMGPFALYNIPAGMATSGISCR